MGFGSKLKKLREERGMSRDDLAKALNVSSQAVYKWETDKGYPDISNMIKISDMFQVTIDDLIKNDKTLQEKIKIDEKKDFMEELSDPGFYIGLILILIGTLAFDGKIANVLTISGLLSILFFSDLLGSLKSFFKKNG